MQCEWKSPDDDLPPVSGNNVVLWSAPYSKHMEKGFSYFDANTGRFDASPAGANEILFWLDGIDELPDIPREGLRTRLVKR